jgi:hypothetical protein
MYKAPFKVVSLVNVYFEAENQKDAVRIIEENYSYIQHAIGWKKNIYVFDAQLNGCAYDPIEPCSKVEKVLDDCGIEFHVDEVDEIDEFDEFDEIDEIDE